ncbi:MAG: MCE family protein [Burkholderiaceae bacterium]|nr:MCE family protein [Burkholderiaceae bacterium]
MENKAHALAAGFFVIGVAALLVAMSMWLMRDTEVRNIYEMSTRESVAGLQPQAAVRYRGLTVGRVTEIGFDPQVRGNVLVRITVADDTPMTRSTFAQLSQQGVTGLAFIQLDDEGESTEPLPPNPEKPPRLPLKPSLFSQLASRGEAILEQVEITTRRVNEIIGPDNQKLVQDTLGNLSAAAGGVNRLTERLDATVTQRLDPALEAMAPAVRDTGAAMVSMKTAADNVARASEDIGNTARRLNAKDGPIDRLAEGTQALSHAADSFNSATLPRINRVTEETSRAARQLSRAANSINDNPQSLLFGNGPVPPGPGEEGFTAPRAGATP